MPKVRIVWPTLFAITSAVLLLVTLYQSSFYPDLGEAESLYMTAWEFGEALLEVEKIRELTPSEIHRVLSDDRFERIQKYGVVIPNDPTKFASIRVNKTYAFDLFIDGRAIWNVNGKSLYKVRLETDSQESAADQNL